MKLSSICLIAVATLATVSGSAFAAPTGPLNAGHALEQGNALRRDDVLVYSRQSGVGVLEREVLDGEDLFTRTEVVAINKVSVWSVTRLVHRSDFNVHSSHQKARKKLAAYLETLHSNNLDPLTWKPVGIWHKVHNDGKATTQGEFRSYTMLGSDGLYQVKVEMNGYAVLSAQVAAPYGSAEVKAALDTAHKAVR